ncbi:MAG: hypothetical protein IJJ76_07635 [Ruminococcus sp.]|uniref:hypothetical protein n=1 Tax=Ruminococcus sp. TaxID=41978 RepID=UPI0025E35EC9|nr:hypothetical protein [Ruminococcus sp.]MBR0529618.1 hypothetical protein [Ruminococcus sp.]
MDCYSLKERGMTGGYVTAAEDSLIIRGRDVLAGGAVYLRWSAKRGRYNGLF